MHSKFFLGLFLPLLLNACGTDDKKKDKQTEEHQNIQVDDLLLVQEHYADQDYLTEVLNQDGAEVYTNNPPTNPGSRPSQWSSGSRPSQYSSSSRPSQWTSSSRPSQYSSSSRPSQWSSGSRPSQYSSSSRPSQWTSSSRPSQYSSSSRPSQWTSGQSQATRPVSALPQDWPKSIFAQGLPRMTSPQVAANLEE